MDVAALRDRIQSTLDANADTRRQAEIDLKYVRSRPFFRLPTRSPQSCIILGRESAWISKRPAGYPAGRAEQCGPAIRYEEPRHRPPLNHPPSSTCSRSRLWRIQRRHSELSCANNLFFFPCCSRRLPEESYHPRMGSRRGQPSAQTHPRRRATGPTRASYPRPRVVAAERARPTNSHPPEDPPT